jgi:hypothetical protein
VAASYSPIPFDQIGDFGHRIWEQNMRPGSNSWELTGKNRTAAAGGSAASSVGYGGRETADGGRLLVGLSHFLTRRRLAVGAGQMAVRSGGLRRGISSLLGLCERGKSEEARGRTRATSWGEKGRLGVTRTSSPCSTKTAATGGPAELERARVFELFGKRSGREGAGNFYR